jgi:hypothetical protein
MKKLLPGWCRAQIKGGNNSLRLEEHDSGNRDNFSPGGVRERLQVRTTPAPSHPGGERLAAESKC